MNAESPTPEVVRILVENHDRFLKFLQPRVGSREIAEDILQAAFVKSFEKADAIRDEGSAVAWFYRVLRNSIVDHQRHHSIDVRAMTAKAKEPQAVEAGDPELERTVCECVKDLIPTLKDEYRHRKRRRDAREGRPPGRGSSAYAQQSDDGEHPAEPVFCVRV